MSDPTWERLTTDADMVETAMAGARRQADEIERLRAEVERLRGELREARSGTETMVWCPACNGSGWFRTGVPEPGVSPCKYCRGSGWVSEEDRARIYLLERD